MGITIADTKAGPIEYADEGSGPVVLLLHGACSSCRERVVHPPLARAGFRVVIPSRPGHGRTPLAAGRTPEQAAEAMAALLDALGIGRAMVLAISTGASTGAVFAARRPDLVAGLVLESAVIDPLAADILPCQGLSGRLLRFAAVIAPRIAANRLLAATSSPERLRRSDYEALRRFFLDHRSRAGEIADRSHTVDNAVLASIRIPTLVIHGCRDQAVSFTNARRAAALVPGARLFAPAAAGHFLWLGPGAEETTQRVIAFMKECATRD
jgi:pimeloyl-ACP methyl ester carboxylesterase